jgi:hypothetical protein
VDVQRILSFLITDNEVSHIVQVARQVKCDGFVSILKKKNLRII